MAFTSSLGLVCYWCDPGVVWGNPQLPVTSRVATLEETGTGSGGVRCSRAFSRSFLKLDSGGGQQGGEEG